MTTMHNALIRLRGAMMKAMPGMITCREFDAFICDYLDGALPDAQRRVFERHMRLCKDCRAYLADYKNSIELHRQTLAMPDKPPQDAPEELIQAVLEARKASREP